MFNSYQLTSSSPISKYFKNFFIQNLTYLDEYGEDFLYSGTLDLWDQGCQESWNIADGCVMTAGGDFIINPIQSAKLISQSKFKFKFGTVEIRAQMPRASLKFIFLSILIFTFKKIL